MCAGHGQHQWALVEKYKIKEFSDPNSLAIVCILSACISVKIYSVSSQNPNSFTRSHHPLNITSHHSSSLTSPSYSQSKRWGSLCTPLISMASDRTLTSGGREASTREAKGPKQLTGTIDPDQRIVAIHIVLTLQSVYNTRSLSSTLYTV